MDPRRIRSLELVERVVRDERVAQLDHFDALDMKAGVILGFAGAIIALSPTAASIATIVGKCLAIVSAMDTMIATAQENDRTLALRGRTLKTAMVTLALAAVLIGTGTWLD